MEAQKLVVKTGDNKSLITNLLALLLLLISFLLPHSIYQQIFANMGLFALSGALTNWLAIHMLFQKVPLLYGSGVILERFAEFKHAIKTLMMTEFFTPAHVTTVLAEQSGVMSEQLLPTLVEQINFETLYDGLIDTLLSSSLGNMIQLIGGKSALAPLKPTIAEKLAISLQQWFETPQAKQKFEAALTEAKFVTALTTKIEQIIDQRLAELTPSLVRDIMQTMIRAHLGWLVVWGGVFGAVIGLLKVILISI
jgi:uncharacterized membrane-anchored protein YjiN (DUF445 family)